MPAFAPGSYPLANGPQHRVPHSHHLLPLCFHNDGLVGLHGLEWEYIPGCRRTGWETLLRPALGPSLSSDLEDSHGACGEATGQGSILDSYTVDVCVWYALRFPTVRHPQKVRGCLTSHRTP